MYWILGLFIYFVILWLAALWLRGAYSGDSPTGYCWVCGENLFVPLSDHYATHPECEAKRFGDAA